MKQDHLFSWLDSRDADLSCHFKTSGGGMKERKERKNSLNGYGEMHRSGITMKEHWATERRIEQDKRQMEQDRLGKGWMGKNT